MSVAGFDIGDQASCVAVARKRGIDVLLNKESKRETPSVVAFGPKQRQMGTDAVGSLNISPKNAVTNLKRLLGKKFSSPQVQPTGASSCCVWECRAEACLCACAGADGHC